MLLGIAESVVRNGLPCDLSTEALAKVGSLLKQGLLEGDEIGGDGFLVLLQLADFIGECIKMRDDF